MQFRLLTMHISQPSELDTTLKETVMRVLHLVEQVAAMEVPEPSVLFQ